MEGDKYNTIIWTIFSIVIIGSLINLYYLWTANNVLELVKIGQLYFGFVGLVYAILLIEGFSQKKECADLKIDNNLNYISVRWIFEYFISLPLLIIYFFSAYYKLNTLVTIKIITILFMILISIILVVNWIRRNCVKKILENRKRINNKKRSLDHLLYWSLFIFLSLLFVLIILSYFVS